MNISATLTVIAEKYQNNRIVLAGDFNIDLSGNSKEKAELINIGNMFALKHLIQVATRIGTTSTCIDNIFTDYDGNIMVNTVETHISDHLAQIARIKLLTSMKPRTEKRLELIRIINKDRISLFKSMLSEVQWERVLHHSNAQDRFSAFHDILVNTQTHKIDFLPSMTSS
ncbi:hypothetical protein QE152_g26915 [Popillia japonica]|uniref:Endonuclease/exonuclease/phosphatase domain-containing protein n=1 Tax=Popillia japonica TaxID=7064 RepID=A0AAW1JX17_POPJA